MTIRDKIREASSIFKFEVKPAREKIETSMKDLSEGLSWARTNGHVELENDALYGLYLCYSRLDQPSPAADQLINIRTNLEDTRSGIKEPLERGGVFQIYPHLFDVLCEKLYMSGRTEELLESIEASKGRGVADILTQKSGKAVADSTIYASVKALPELTRQFQFHYLTFYVDVERTYAVLVNKDGTIHPGVSIDIKKSELREASQFVKPQLWGTPMDYDPSIKAKDISLYLAPLIDWLGDLLESGSLSFGDHICYSADESINNIPIQYVLLNGKPLLNHFSISKIHNSFHLQQVLSKPSKGHPKSSNSFVVPSRQDIEKKNWKTLRSYFFEPVYSIKKLLKGSILKEEDCDFDSLRQQKLKNKVLHFSTHGYFPTEEESQKPNPFYRSGLILACQGQLPDVGILVKNNEKFLLTPEKILNFALEFDNSHISMMACVSGLSKEGLGGDALGLDWALIQAGATSILASHWHVRAELAAMFFERFYHYWLEEKKSRAHSYSLAVKDLSSRPENLEHPYEWAAFSLSGDWR